MVASGDSGRPGESATEKTPPSGAGEASPGSKGEMARQELTALMATYTIRVQIRFGEGYR